MHELEDGFNRLILHPDFNETIAELNKLKIRIPEKPEINAFDFQGYDYGGKGKLEAIEKIQAYKLDPKRGQKLAQSNIPLSAYDESINTFSALEGKAALTSHSLVVHGKNDFLPSTLLTFYFYTRSEAYTKKAQHIKYSVDPESDSKRDYILDKTEFIVQNTPNNAVVFIDGPLIGGQLTYYTNKLNGKLLEKEAIPIFVVKNSMSTLVTDNITELKGKYNSDLHWTYNLLKEGQRSNFFKYTDEYDKKNVKIFCYLKSFNLSPQRVEFHIDTFKKYEAQISSIMDLVYYLVLCQGDLTNPQIRTIAIAEKYARATLRLVDLNKLIRDIGFTPTMNQERFGWS